MKRDELGEATARLIARYALDAEGFVREWPQWLNGRVWFTGTRE